MTAANPFGSPSAPFVASAGSKLWQLSAASVDTENERKDEGLNRLRGALESAGAMDTEEEELRMASPPRKGGAVLILEAKK